MVIVYSPGQIKLLSHTIFPTPALPPLIATKSSDYLTFFTLNFLSTTSPSFLVLSHTGHYGSSPRSVSAGPASSPHCERTPTQRTRTPSTHKRRKAAMRCCVYLVINRLRPPCMLTPVLNRSRTISKRRDSQRRKRFFAKRLPTSGQMDVQPRPAISLAPSST